MVKDHYIEVVAVKIAFSDGVSRSFLSLPSSARDGSRAPSRDFSRREAPSTQSREDVVTVLNVASVWTSGSGRIAVDRGVAAVFADFHAFKPHPGPGFLRHIIRYVIEGVPCNRFAPHCRQHAKLCQPRPLQ